MMRGLDDENESSAKTFFDRALRSKLPRSEGIIKFDMEIPPDGTPMVGAEWLKGTWGAAHAMVVTVNATNTINAVVLRNFQPLLRASLIRLSFNISCEEQPPMN